MNKETLKKIMPLATTSNIEKFFIPLVDSMDYAEINTPQRKAAYLAQLAHESGSFRYVREIHDGSNYEGRKDLGNIHPGDGKKFRGRGLIQVTGRANYEEISKDLGVDFVSNPELLESPKYATLSAAWFWKKRRLNKIADSGDFKLLTKRINGGYNGLKERTEYYNRALTLLQ